MKPPIIQPTVGSGATPKKTVVTTVIQADSAGFNGGNYAKITINNTPISMRPNESNHLRGLHVAVINP